MDCNVALRWHTQMTGVRMIMVRCAAGCAGKPIFSLHGDENALAGLMAVLQALISFAKDQGDALLSVK